MNHTNDKVKRICNFYVSDLHFAVMLLPYINNEINNGTEIETIFEKDMKDYMDILLKKTNIENKDKILKINWNKEVDFKNIEKKIRKNLTKRGNKILIVNGSNQYIDKVNNKIDENIDTKKLSINELRIIDCYQVEENEKQMYKIIKMHDSILNTIGEQEIEKII